MSPGRVLRRSAVVAAGLVVVVSGCSGVGGPPPEAGQAVTAFAKAWAAGKAETVLGAAPDQAKAAKTAIADATKRLQITSTKVRTAGDVTCLDGDEKAAAGVPDDVDACRQQLGVTHEMAGLGPWTYAVTAEVREDEGGSWRVHWTPSTFHPQLSAGTRFNRVRNLPSRASILDRNGDPITEDRPVVYVGVEPRRVDPDQTYAELERIVGIDGAELRKRAEAAPPTRFVDVITLREAVYEGVEPLLDETPGVIVREGVRSLAPTTAFARGVLGYVATATAETLKEAGPFAVSTDDIGLSGLQRAYQKQLAGEAGGRVETVDKDNGALVQEIFERRPKRGKPIETTLDMEVQEAAEAALEGVEKPLSVVAVQPSTGEILAVANGPGITEFNRGMVGKYPPGSTFKVVSAAVLLENGLRLDDKVECPAETNVGGKRFKNAYDTTLPDGPFLRAFAHSCNTTVVGRASSVDDQALTETAERFGIGAKWDVGVPAFSGSVPDPADLVDRAATMIGQGRVEMSALGMALVAAAVDAGEVRAPVLLPKDKPAPGSPGELPAEVVEPLRTLMREVVTTGSAKSLNLPGDPVHAKTGTAEYGGGDPPRTHAWMIGFRGDLAFAVVIEDGGSGGKDAGPVARRFLEQAEFPR